VALFAGASVAIVACTAGDVDLSGKLCPCATGWYCDRPTRTCLPGIAPDEDAGSIDAAGPDAGGLDAGRDGGTRDAGGDGGTDDGGTDAGSDAGPGDTQCDDRHAGAVFCDGFETESFAAWTDTAVLDGSLERSTTETFLGDGSLDAEVDAPGGRAITRYFVPTAFGAGDDVYVRAWIFIPAELAIPGGFTFIQASEGPAPYHHLSFSVNSSDVFTIFYNSDGASENLFGGLVRRDAWFCVEARVYLHDTDGIVEFWMDGVRQGGTSATDTLPATGYERILAGVAFSGAAQPTARVLIDEVVVDMEPIGCD